MNKRIYFHIRRNTNKDTKMPQFLNSQDTLPVAIIGGGPVGLAAVAHLHARNIPFRLFEAGSDIAQSVLDWSHIRLFTPWQFNVDQVAADLLTRNGWHAPDPHAIPTGAELRDLYLQPLAHLPEFAPHIECGSRILSLARRDIDKVRTDGRERHPFEILVQRLDNTHHWFSARAVIDASGTWRNPSPLGAFGLPADGEQVLSDRIVYGVPDILGRDKGRYMGRKTLVVGAGHSAANTLIALASLAEDVSGTQIAWVLRGKSPDRLFGAGEADDLQARGALGNALRGLYLAGKLETHEGFRLTGLSEEKGGVTVTGRVDGVIVQIGPFDEIVAATGQRPDLEMTRELRLDLDPSLECSRVLAPMIDPNVHSCGTVPPHGHRELSHPEPGYYSAGIKSYGRAPTFLLATGYEQVRSITAALAGDFTAADAVRLVLPQTGICGTGFRADMSVVFSEDSKVPESEGCCGGAPPEGVNACCLKDADAKSAGESGCGCGDKAEAGPRPAATCC